MGVRDRRLRQGLGPTLNWIDVLIIVLAIVAAVWGATSGFIAQAAVLIGVLAGLAGGGALAVFVGHRVVNPNLRATIGAALIFGCVVVAYIIAASLGAQLRRRVPEGALRGIDTGLGAGTAVIAVALVAWLIAVPIAESPFGGIADAMRSSFAMRVVRNAPPPNEVLGGFRSALRAGGFPTVFENLPTQLGGPTSPPDPTVTAMPAIRDVANSTLKLTAQTCSAGSEGSGWVYAPNHIATNAHVVAGSRNPIKVEVPNGPTLKGTVVAFDPGRDVAVVYVPKLPAQTVNWTTRPAATDQSVAALGYPENGPFTATPGRVRTTLTAKGRDIYDEQLVDRNIFEMSTRIRPGNSGGPMVASDGTVYGMVFAASSTNPDLGYALTGTEISPILEAARDATARIDTGHCIH